MCAWSRRRKVLVVISDDCHDCFTSALHLVGLTCHISSGSESDGGVASAQNFFVGARGRCSSERQSLGRKTRIRTLSVTGTKRLHRCLGDRLEADYYRHSVEYYDRHCRVHAPGCLLH